MCDRSVVVFFRILELIPILRYFSLAFFFLLTRSWNSESFFFSEILIKSSVFTADIFFFLPVVIM